MVIVHDINITKLYAYELWGWKQHLFQDNANFLTRQRYWQRQRCEVKQVNNPASIIQHEKDNILHFKVNRNASKFSPFPNNLSVCLLLFCFTSYHEYIQLSLVQPIFFFIQTKCMSHEDYLPQKPAYSHKDRYCLSSPVLSTQSMFHHHKHYYTTANNR